ncbi:Carbohydrate esterase family 9 protein [Rhizoctonia solani]|uniref:Carbohydrate esterase family 9 protein n=1 Tax=Rhizoctonia solani TaxID=456999 RepID=A0A8H7LKH0_9AGAM|nr:Carbohydrate esterase family 9 protein [Rhizoctonia solani]
MASKDPTLPPPALISRRKTATSLQLNTLGLVALGSIGFLAYNVLSLPHLPKAHPLPPHALESLSKCRSLNLKPGPPKSFWSRTESERWEPGTPPTLIQNATIWTGGDNGDEVVLGDILLDKGIIKAVGRVPSGLLDAVGNKLVVKNVQGAWVSPGDHLGVDSVPELRGAADTNSFKAPTMPYLRSLDGFNTHDTAFALSRSGGVATALILPGSADNIGGQAFVVKIRKTSHGGPSSMVLEPPATLHINGTRGEADGVRWRHIKHACGENPSRVYKQTRMDSIWEFRKAYNSAREVKQQQDAFCARADVDWSKESFPEDLQFEALVDVLRGRVKVNIHCYQAVDFDGIVRLTNEFKFPVAAFHHAHEAYLVPDILKSAWGDVPPAVALFATNARYKYEAYRGSEFAPKILHDNGFRVVMKSDHPVLNSRYLLYEAAQAHYYGLPAGPALSSVITTPAEVAGFGHRLGRVQNGYDADIVVWDSHPLTLGATPKQLYIDGIAQLSDPVVVAKPSTFQRIPATPNWGKAPQEAVEYDGLPPLQSNSGKDQSQAVVFTRVKDVWTSSSGELQLQSLPADSVVVVSSGRITCVGSASRCSSSLSNTKVVDLAHGSLSPGLISFGAPLGLEEISAESSTNDGTVPDPFDENGVPKVAGGDDLVVRAIDGLSFAGRDTLLAHRAGVTTAVSAPVSSGLFSGASVAFRTGASHKLEDGAIVNSAPALHLSVGHGSSVSVSTQIATLRRLLLKNLAKKGKHDLVAKALGGQVPLVIKVHKADDMATLLELKSEIEDLTSVPLRLTFAGATEAHLIAKEIAEAGVGVIVIPSRSFPSNWDQARVLPGPPLSRDSLITKLLKANVTVGLGVVEAWEARNTRFDIGWAALESDGDINKQDALALGTTNLQKLLGLEGSELLGDLVAYHGGDCFDLASRPVAVVSGARGTVDLF